jgi:hypothetical protein
MLNIHAPAGFDRRIGLDAQGRPREVCASSSSTSRARSR